jgi:hypothetical protein
VRSEFVPVTGNTQDLQWHRSLTQQWFLGVVDRSMKLGVSTRSGSLLSGEAPGAKNTRLDLNRQMECTLDPQGMYILGPDGSTYGFTNDHEPTDIQKFMDGALAKYRAHPPKRVVITDAEKRSQFAITPATSTTVLAVYSRIRSPIPKGCSYLNESIGRDFCWIYADEVAALARAANGKAAGTPIALPQTLVRRIARFHLVDGVRGTPDLWSSEQIRRLHITAKAFPGANGTATIMFGGPFAMQNGRGSHGYEGTLEGKCVVDSAQKKLVRFRSYASGQAWGPGTYTPNPPPGKFRLAIGFMDTTAPIARIVPPEEVATYNRDTRYRHP